MLSKHVSTENFSELYYSTKYSNEAANAGIIENEMPINEESNLLDIVVWGIGMVGIGTLIAVCEAIGNLKYEPLQLLAKQVE